MVEAKDFSQSSFNVVMARCQRTALEYWNLSVPDPAKQLEMLAARRKKGKGKRGGAANLRPKRYGPHHLITRSV